MKNKFSVAHFLILILLYAVTSFPASGQTREEINGAIKSGKYDIARKMANQLIKMNDPTTNAQAFSETHVVSTLDFII